MRDGPDPAGPGAPGRAGLLRLLPLAGLAAAAVLGMLLFGDRLSFETLAENRARLIAFRDAHYATTVVLFVAAYATIVALSLPGATVSTLAGGFLFLTFPGVLINMTAATLGASLLFLTARRGLGERLAARMNASAGAVRRIKHGIDRNQWEMLFLMRLIPAMPFCVANLVPALLGVPFHRYLITTALGILPAALVYTSVGAGLSEVFASGGRPDLGAIFSPPVLLPILGLCGLVVLTMVVRARRRAGP